MKVKRFTTEDIYFKMMEDEFRKNKVSPPDRSFIYFASYYINKFTHTNLQIQSYIGLKKKDHVKDVFVITFPLSVIGKKENKKIFFRYFEEGIRHNDRYIGLLKTNKELGFLFRHDDELLQAYKTGQFSKISELKKNKMKHFRVMDYDIKVRAFYIIGKEKSKDDWKNYPLGKRDLLTYELYKMIHPEFFYPILSEQFNVKIDYLKKHQVQILPKPDFEKEYFILHENHELYWFEKK